MNVSGSADQYEKIKTEARSFYYKIGTVWSPQLKDCVVFNSTGFRHLLYKKGILRSKEEQEKRFALLVYVEDMISDRKTAIVHKKRETVRRIKWRNRRFSKISFADYWEFTVSQGGKTIIAVVRQFDSKQKHFLTTYQK